ncbi:hypothetical protein [Lentilactobacillus parafarraginis]|uniref:hypothetical protein n=1 Tax=Lentilactobacillus parafarraginis TaxID=390842 RepID=UPI001CDC06BD|nr:hypothetical protein [Lentilactobacillus parafarraginis]
MQKEHTLTSNDYFQRIIIFIALVVLVLIVQIPLSFIMMGKLSTIGSLAMSGGYILGFVIAIWIAVSVYRHYVHPVKKAINGHDINDPGCLRGVLCDSNCPKSLEPSSLSSNVYCQQSGNLPDYGPEPLDPDFDGNYSRFLFADFRRISVSRVFNWVNVYSPVPHCRNHC